MGIGRFYDLIFSITELDLIDSIGWLLSITVGRIVPLEGMWSNLPLYKEKLLETSRAVAKVY